MQNRRLFLKNGLAVIAMASVAKASLTTAATTQTKWGMIIDINRCTGCQSCVIACKAQNRTVQDKFNTKVQALEDGNYPDTRIIFTPIQCNHCENPPCVPACPLNATYKMPNGIVVTDWEKCKSYGTCVKACPYDARFLDKRHENKVDKCDFCLDRLEQGLLPACVEACSSKARLFGDMNAPKDEFAEYLKRRDLKTRKPKLKLATSVRYVASGKGKKGGSL